MNLFSAGTNFAAAASTGTGFFLGRAGNIFTIFAETPIRDFYTMRILKNPSFNETFYSDIPEPIENTFKNLHFGRDFINDFKSELIDLQTENISEKELCHEDHCCLFTIDTEAPSANSFQYRLVAFNGFRHYSGWGEKKLVICAIMICNDQTLNSCGRMPNYDLARVSFETIEISTKFNRFGVLMMPNSLDLNMNPLNVDQFAYDEAVSSEATRTSTIKLLKPHSDLQTFALYGHDYEVDDEFDFKRGSEEVE